MPLPPSRTKALIAAGTAAMAAYQDLAKAIQQEAKSANSPTEAGTALLTLLTLADALAPPLSAATTLSHEAAWWRANHRKNEANAKRMARRRAAKAQAEAQSSPPPDPECPL